MSALNINLTGNGQNLLPGSVISSLPSTGASPISSLNLGGATPINLPPSVGGGYGQNLNNAQSSYQQILNAYQNALNRQQAAEQTVIGGYGALGNQVQGLIANQGQTGEKLIQQQFDQSAGALQSQLQSSGFTSTKPISQTAGMLQSYGIAQGNLQEQLAALKAGYAANTGMAGLGYAGQSIGADTALINQGLGAGLGAAGNLYGNFQGNTALSNQYAIAQQQMQLQRELAQLRQYGGYGYGRGGYGGGGGSMGPTNLPSYAYGGGGGPAGGFNPSNPFGYETQGGYGSQGETGMAGGYSSPTTDDTAFQTASDLGLV